MLTIKILFTLKKNYFVERLFTVNPFVKKTLSFD